MFNIFKKRRLKYSFYGNCQLENICRLLNNSKQFRGIYEYIPVKAVHELEKLDLKIVTKSFKEIDLLLYQAVSPSFKNGPEFASDNIIQYLKPSCKKILIPSLFFNPYFPDFHEVNIDKYGLLTTSFLCNYQDLNILYGFINNISETKLYKIYSNINFYEKPFCQETLSNAFLSMREREASNNVDIKISDFIEQNFKKFKLFNSQNHPKPIIMQYVIDKIIHLLGLEISITATKTLLDGLEYHIHPSIHKNLELTFDNKIEFITLAGNIDNYRRIIHLFYLAYQNIDINYLKQAFANKEHIESNFKRISV